MRNLQLVPLILAFLIVPAASGGEFPLKDGDVWVMAGDSITAQHLHSNYFEAFCFARYPQLKFAFRNSGVGGHTIPSTLARFDYDVAAWKPTVISIELGMNDSGGTLTPDFITNMDTMVERIRSVGARPVILTASPVNDGTTMAKLAGRNVRLNEYADALRPFCEKKQLPFADQFHLLIDVWGINKPRELLANTLPALRGLAQDEKVAGVDHLRAFLAAQDAAPDKPVSMQGDPVHPGVPGQLMMAAALLKELGAEASVSSATLDASGKVVESKGCKIENVQAAEGRLAFDRLDESLPFPIPEEAAAALPLYPAIQELSRYALQVQGLKPGQYVVKINTAPLPAVSDKALAQGINLTVLAYAPGASNPIVAQGRGVLNAVAVKENLVTQWRGLSQRAHAAGAAAELKDQLTELTKQVQAADDKIREAAKPQTLHVEIVPAG